MIPYIGGIIGAIVGALIYRIVSREEYHNSSRTIWFVTLSGGILVGLVVRAILENIFL